MIRNINLTSKSFNLLKPLIHKQVPDNAEAMLYLYWDGKTVIKKYIDFDDDCFNRKIKTIFETEKIKNEIDIDDLTYIDAFTFVDGKLIGPGMPYVKGNAVGVMLDSKKVPIKVKIAILKQMGSILSKLAAKYDKYKVAFGDVHSNNFIYNGKSVKAIDIDGIRVGKNITTTSNYLNLNQNISGFEKYEFKNHMHTPNPDSDIMCFIFIILEMISEANIWTLPYKKYMEYLDYLAKLGFNCNLLNCFAAIYQKDTDNINPTPFLDSIKSSPKDCSFTAYSRLKH